MRSHSFLEDCRIAGRLARIQIGKGVHGYLNRERVIFLTTLKFEVSTIHSDYFLIGYRIESIFVM